MKIIDDIWFTSTSTIPGDACVGIVITEDDVSKGRKAFIGTGEGSSVEADKRRVAHFGNSLSEATLLRVLRGLNSSLLTMGLPQRNKLWTMTCLMEGAKLMKMVDLGRTAEIEEALKALSSEFTPQDVEYLTGRLTGKE